jgi:hypothetical protein
MLGWEGAPHMPADEACAIEGGYGPLVIERDSLTDADFADKPIRMPPMPSDCAGFSREILATATGADWPGGEIDVFGPSLWARFKAWCADHLRHEVVGDRGDAYE